MSILGSRYLVVAVVSIFLGIVALLVSFEAYSVATNNQTAASVNATQVNIGQNFKWKTGEVINIQGNQYAYLGYELNPQPDVDLYSLRLARLQNTWIELTYSLTYQRFATNEPTNVTLTPYKLQIINFNNDYLNATILQD